MNSVAIKYDFLTLANNLGRRVIVKMIDRDVESAWNMASIEETPDAHVYENCIEFVLSAWDAYSGLRAVGASRRAVE